MKERPVLVKTSFTVLVLGLGMALGISLNSSSTLQSVSAQETVQIPIKGHGRAISTVTPPESEQFTLIAANALNRSFKVVPAKKKFVLTDVMYIAQGNVREDLTVNISDAITEMKKQEILFQVRLSPGESDEVHLCSGYVIPAGHSLVAYTNAGLQPGQYVSVSVTGFLADE